MEALSFIRPCQFSPDTELQYALLVDGSFEVASRTNATSFAVHARGRLVADATSESTSHRVSARFLSSAGPASKTSIVSRCTARSTDAPRRTADVGASSTDCSMFRLGWGWQAPCE